MESDRRRPGFNQVSRHASNPRCFAAGRWLALVPFFLLLMTPPTLCAAPPAALPIHWSQLPALPDPLGVAGPFAGVGGGALLVAGGANFPGKPPWQGGKKIWHDAVYVLTGLGGQWQLAGKLPRPLAYGVSVTIPAGVVCIGGSDADCHYRDVFLLVWREGKLSIESLADLPVPLANAAGALVGSVIYVAGGSETPGEQTAVSQCFALDLKAAKPAWTVVPACPGKARILPVAAAGSDAFYLFGGAALEPVNGKVKRVYLRDAWRYQPTIGWQRLADLPRPCVAGPTPAPRVADRFFLAGGDDGSLAGFQPPEKHPGFNRQLLAYDADADRWTTNGEVPAARATLPTAFWHDRFVIPSGEMRPGVRSPEVWMFRPEAKP